MDSEEENQFGDYIASMYKSMNLGVNPRDDLTEFTLSRDTSWLGRDSTSLRDLFDFLNNNEEFKYPSFVKVKNFYRSTGDQELLNSGEIYDKLCEYNGGWPILNTDWCPDKFDWIRTLGFLGRMGVDTLFEIDIRYTATETIFTLALQQPCCEYYSIEETCDTIEGKYEEDNLYSEEARREIVDELRSLLEGIQNIFSRNIQHHQRNLVRYTSEEIKQREGFNFGVFFETYFGKPISDNQIFQLDFPEYADEYLNFLSEQKPRALANFIMAQYLNILECTSYKKVIFKYFAPVIIAVTISTYFNENDRRKQIEIFTRYTNLYEKIKKEVGGPRQENLERLLNDRISTIEFLLDQFSMERIDREYENWEIDPEDYHKNLFNMNSYNIPDSLKTFHFVETPETERWKLNLKYFIFDCIKTHNKPLLDYYHCYMFKHVYSIAPLKLGKDNKTNVKKVVENYKNKYDLEWSANSIEENIRRTESFICAYRYTFNDYRDWLKENPVISKQQDEVLAYINLDNYKAYFITFFQRNSSFRDNIGIDYLCWKHFRHYKVPHYLSEYDDD